MIIKGQVLGYLIMIASKELITIFIAFFPLRLYILFQVSLVLVAC